MSRVLAISDVLAGDIALGRYAPGERLPNYQELQATYGASSVTISRAVRLLIENEHVVSRKREGVFVAERPPFTRRLGLVFPSAPDERGRWNRYYDVLSCAALEARQGYSFRQYYQVDGRPDRAAQARLVEDAARWRIGGVLFASPPYPLSGTPLLQAAFPPRVAVMSEPSFSHTPVMRLAPSLDAALGVLARRGCRRVARLCNSSMATQTAEREAFVAAVQAHGLETRPRWTQYIDLNHPAAARPATLSFFHAEQTVRPDALFIQDDNLVPWVEAALSEAPVTVPERVRVLALCNFPQPRPGRVPIERLGYDLRVLLDQAIERLRDGLRGDSRAGVSVVPLCIEDADGALRPLAEDRALQGRGGEI